MSYIKLLVSIVLLQVFCGKGFVQSVSGVECLVSGVLSSVIFQVYCDNCFIVFNLS